MNYIMTEQNDNINVKQKKIYKKNIKFKKERLDILLKIYTIIGLNETNKKFTTLDINEIKQNQIMELVPEITKYFRVSSWSYFNKKKIIDKPHLSIIRCIFREMNITYACSSCKIKNENQEYINTTIYILNNL